MLHSLTTSVIQTNMMVVNGDSQFCGHTNSSIQVIITGIKSKAPKSKNKMEKNQGLSRVRNQIA